MVKKTPLNQMFCHIALDHWQSPFIFHNLLNNQRTPIWASRCAYDNHALTFGYFADQRKWCVYPEKVNPRVVFPR